MSYTAYGCARYIKGDNKEAKKFVRKGRDLCERVGFIGWAAVAHECLGKAYFCMKDYEISTECWLKIIRSHKAGRINPSLVSRCKLPLILNAVMLGERDVELEPLRKISKDEIIKLYVGCSSRYMA